MRGCEAEERLAECKFYLEEGFSVFYDHWKGDKYMVVCIAKDADILEPVVVYQHVKTGEYFTRLAMEFFEYIEIETYKGFRFTNADLVISPVCSVAD